MVLIGFSWLFPRWPRFAAFMLILILNACAATSLGLAVSAAAPSIQIAASSAPVCMVLMLLLGGFYVNTANIPDWCRWVSHISFVRWSFAALAINEFRGLAIDCPPRSAVTADCARSGDQVLSRLSLEHLSLTHALLGQSALIVALNVLAFLGLHANQPSFQPILPVTPPPAATPATSPPTTQPSAPAAAAAGEAPPPPPPPPPRWWRGLGFSSA